MSESLPTRLPKWPFLLSDLVLLSLAGWLIFRSPAQLGRWEACLSLAATLAGAAFCVLPFLRDHQAATKLAQAKAMAEPLEQLHDLLQVKDQISNAIGQWQAVQEDSKRTIAAAGQMSGQMQTELANFQTFLQKAHDAERDHLRLEVEKQRRAEGQWVHLSVHILDHVFALHKAASQSGNSGLIAQLNQFQFACRDAVRRVGLVVFAPAAGERFDEQTHQLEEGAKAPSGAVVRDVLASGYTYQGKLLRQAVVRLETDAKMTAQTAPSTGPTPDPDLDSGAPAAAEVGMDTAKDLPA
jgi:molecular chaperone GrpE (heat shock protein)